MINSSTFRGFAGARMTILLVPMLLLVGCHSDTQQGGGSAGGRSEPQRKPTQTVVPTPPTADQTSPSSPEAILDGTSTTTPSVSTQSSSQKSNASAVRSASPR